MMWNDYALVRTICANDSESVLTSSETVQDVQLLTLLDVIGVPTTTQTRLYREVLRTAKDFEEMDANGVDYGTTQLLFGVGGGNNNRGERESLAYTCSGDRIDDLKRRLKGYEANQIRYYPTEHDDIVEMDKVSNLPFWRDGRRYKDVCTTYHTSCVMCYVYRLSSRIVLLSSKERRAVANRCWLRSSVGSKQVTARDWRSLPADWILIRRTYWLSSSYRHKLLR